MNEADGKTSIQLVSEKARALYQQEGAPPLLQQALAIHQVSYRQFADIFGISLGHAQNIIKHKVFPSLELGIAISRYFECTVEELFGWRVDDDGKRCPLMYLDLKSGKLIKCMTKGGEHERTLDLVRRRLERKGERC